MSWRHHKSNKSPFGISHFGHVTLSSGYPKIFRFQFLGMFFGLIVANNCWWLLNGDAWRRCCDWNRSGSIHSKWNLSSVWMLRFRRKV